MTFIHDLLEFEDLDEITDERGRRYTTPDGKVYPSVTTFLGSVTDKSFLEDWKAKVGIVEAERIKNESARRGTQLHLMCERFLTNQDVITSDQLSKDVKFFNSLRPVIRKKINNVRALEAPLYSHTLKLAGRVDCIAEWNKELAIIDFKNARSPRKREWILNYFWQTTIYSIMLQELTGLVAKKLVILMAIENEAFPQVFVEERKDHLKDVMRAIKGYHNERKIIHV